MPVYEYRCDECGERFEELVSAASAKAHRCPKCGSVSVTRLYSPFATEWKPGNVDWHRLP